MDFKDRVYRKSDTIVFRKIGDECVLVPIKHDVGEIESIYTLNETAAYIWDLIDGKSSVGEIKERIIDEYAIDPVKAEMDLIEHLRQLEGIKAVIET